MRRSRVVGRALALLGAFVVLGGCSAPVTHPMGRASAPRGIVFIEGPMVKTAHGWKSYRDVRAFRDGRLLASYDVRVLAARDRAAASLIFDEAARTVRPIGGGRAWPFDPCPDTSGAGNYVELSPSGRRGLCASEWNSAVKANQLILFDPRSPRTSRRVIFSPLGVNGKAAAWIDEGRIAVTEDRPDACPRGPKGYDDPTGLAIIDLRGHVLERGPCVFYVLAGPRGLVLAQAFARAMRFSADGGKTWSDGRPQFADADGKVFYQSDRWDDYVLYEGGNATAFRDVHGATWAKP
jgi:hypothetical protein